MDLTAGLGIGAIEASPREGIERSFADFYSAHRDSTYRAVLVARRNPHRAEDAMQEAYLRAYDRWDSVQHYRRPHAWVVRVALNVATSWWRRHRREQASPPDRPAPPDMRPVPERNTGSWRGLDGSALWPRFSLQVKRDHHWRSRPSRQSFGRGAR